ncbi:MAG: LysM peptidoglycan-binding domain-containing protein [Pseudonocardia sp.]
MTEELGVGRGSTRARRSSAGRVAPVPTGPGRTAHRPDRRAGRAVPGGRAGVGLRQPTRLAGWAGTETLDRRVVSRGWRGLVLVGLGSAVVVFGLGALADGMAVVRVPAANGSVVVRADETLWQVANRAAPSAEPGAVVRRIVELNDLVSPSVQPGQVLVSPIG